MTERPRVFVTRQLPEAGLNKLRESCEVTVWPEPLPPDEDALCEMVRGCSGLLCLLTDPVTARVMDSSADLRAISTYAVGFNNIDVKAATERGIAVGNTPGVLTDATADLAFALLIAAARCLRPGHENAVSGQWKTWEPLGFMGQELAGKTLGIVGLGRIGEAMAKRCIGGWGMKVLYHNPRRNERAERELPATWTDLDTLLTTSDFVSLHCPLTADNRGLMGAEQFGKMKRSAVFVNTARGALVDQAALLKALADGTIFAAGIDVTDPEPPKPDDPLFRQANLVVMPHIASGTFATRDRMAVIAADNLLAGLRGEAMAFPVNPGVKARERFREELADV